MAEVQLSADARADLSEIRHYSNAQFGGDVADAYYSGFEDAFDLLERHPFAEASMPAFGKTIRGLAYKKHRIFYTVKGDIVLIIRVIHHARNARRVLKWTP